MDIRQMRTFVKLAQTLNYAQTARELYISQPAVTQQIEKLERELGARLFDRDTRHVELTAAGRIFLRDCADIVSRFDQACVQVKEHARHFESSLRVACSSNRDIECLPRLLACYRQACPDVHLYVSHGNPVDKLASLRQGKYDVLLAARPNTSAPAGISFRGLYRGQFVCVMPNDHPLAAERGPLPVSAMARESLIFLEDGACPSEMAEVQDRIGWELPDTVAYYSGSAVISACMIEAGLGLVVMPDFACPARPGLTMRPVEGFAEPEYGVFWVTADKTERTREFVECAAQVLGKN